MAFGAQLQAPPVSNTGAQNTTSLSACIDWLECTFPVSVTLDEILDRLLPFDAAEWRPMERGRWGYRQGLIRGHIQVLYDGNPDMGPHVVMSGQGVREFEQEVLRGDATRWASWIVASLGMGARFTRIDLAIDDRVGYWTLDQIEDELKRYQRGETWRIRSLWKGGQVQYEFALADGEKVGKTIYFGSAQSNARLRMYDKAAEQGVEGTWIRTEVQLRDENASGCASLLAAGTDIGRVVAGILSRYLNFLDPADSDSNKSRRSVARWWAAFLGEVEKLRLTLPKPMKALAEKARHIVRQYGPSLAQLRAWMGASVFDRWLDAVLRDGYKRMRDYHWTQVRIEGGCVT